MIDVNTGKEVDPDNGRYYLRNSPAFENVSAAVILKNGKEVGRILAVFRKSGRTDINLFDWTDRENGTTKAWYNYTDASGTDIIMEALAGLPFGDHVLSKNHGYEWPDYLRSLGYEVIRVI